MNFDYLNEEKERKRKLDKERLKEICECVCGYYPLKHFQRCPKCNSEAFHKVIKKINKDDIKEKFPEIEIFEDKNSMLKSIKKKVIKEGDNYKIDYEFGLN